MGEGNVLYQRLVNFYKGTNDKYFNFAGHILSVASTQL